MPWAASGVWRRPAASASVVRIARSLDTARGLARRAGHAAGLHVRFLRSPIGDARTRLGVALCADRAVATRSAEMPWFGRRLAFDSPWTPLLMLGYPREVAAILAAAPELGSRPRVLDVGANIGQFAATLLAMRPEARVWSLEPNPHVLPLLERNAAGDARWRVLPFGCAAADEDADLWFVPGRSSQGSVFAANATLGLLSGHAERTTVPLRRLSAALRAEHDLPDRFDLVKVDVEGAERGVVEGLAEVGWRYLMVEVSTGREGRMTESELLDLLRRGHPAARVVATLSRTTACTEVLLADPAG